MSDLIDRQAAIMGLIFSDGTRNLTCGQMAKILNAIKALPSVQPDEKRAEKRTETHACDCISRSAVVDALYDWSEHSMTDAESWHIRQVIGDIKSLPPAEPNCSEIPNNSDCISRQAAITAIQKAYADTEGGTDKCAVWKNVGLTNALHIMQDLPSAQPASYRQVTGKLDSVSRQAEIDAWKADFKGYVDSLDLLRDDYNGIMEYIDETPSAQPDIIRCKDCKYSDENWRRVSVKWLPCMDIRPGSNWYCGSAERRTDENNNE